MFRAVVVGAGMAADFWLPPLCARDDVQITAIVEIDPARGSSLIERYGLGCEQYPQVATAVTETDANLVVNLTPPAAHRAVAEEALAAGCDVFGEKPVAESLADARAITASARAAGRRYIVMQNRRFAPGMRALREGIAAGLIGRPTFVCADMFVAPHHYGGFREETMEHPLLLDMAIHTFDQARFLIGADPVSVYCHEFNPAGSWYLGNAAASCVFEFGDGTVFSYRGSWVGEGCATSFDATWRVTGTAGSVLWDGVGAPRGEAALRSDSRYFWPTERVGWPNPELDRDATHHSEAIEATLNTLRAGGCPETDSADNIPSLAMALAAIISGRERRLVSLPR
ncbi:Gfo/Idh/MocA family protein [Pseudonocardia acaciae]|uniref:Gfo/Idh/MocA family protein n=1 Tax=Pseudonocardia acaciae TaxID=551276 RepID=UPI00146FD916|nr:Gfo/Idh/MocA family oxidoreductase [Pseudonocardia acaciae]